MGGSAPSIPRALRLEPRRQDERLAQMGRIFVRREARTVGGDLEQHAAGLLEVHRLEPEAIDDAGRLAARGLDLCPHRQLMRVIVHAPGKMVHRAHAPAAAPLIGRLADVDEACRVGKPVPRPSVLVAQALEAERAGQEAARGDGAALPEPRAVQAANLPLRRHGAAVPRRERPRRSRGALDERQAKPVHVDDRQVPVAESRFRRLDANAVSLEPRAPVLQAAGGNLEARFDRQAVPDPRRRVPRPREERQVGARAALGVRVEEVIGARVVLVHAPLDQVHAQDAGVEIDVLLRRARDGGDVVETVDAPQPVLQCRMPTACLWRGRRL